MQAIKKTKLKTCREDKIYYSVCYTIIILLTLIVLYPMIYVVSASVSSGTALMSGEVWLFPKDITFLGYKTILQYKNVWIGYRNTIFYTVIGTFINVVMTLLCAYPLTRNNLMGRKQIMMLFTFTMLFSGGMIPNYILMKKLHLLNTVWVMIIPGALSVYNMIVTKTFIQSSIPEELLEASKIDGTRLCHDELRRKKISALIPPRKGAGYWPGEYADRNRAVANQRMTGSNARWKWTTDYNRRSIAETAMYRVKQLFGGALTLRDYDGQVAEAMALVRALNKMTKAGIPESVRIA